MKKILPFISIIAISAFAGNMINIGLSYAIHWQSLDPIAFMESFKVDFPLLLGPTSVTLMPAFIATLWLAIITKQNKPARRYWIFAFAALMLINIQTVAYHLPMNLDFMELSFTASEATDNLRGWIIFHWLRILIAIMAGISAIKAFQIQTTTNPSLV